MGNDKTDGREKMTKNIQLTTLLTAAVLSPLDYYIVNLTLPSIQADLKTTPQELQMIVSLYSCMYAVFLIPGGRLGDIYGRKKMFLTGLAGFTVASLLCGISVNGTMLVCSRMLQGTFAAILSPQVVAFIKVLFTTEEQPRVMGTYGAVFGMAAVAGQLLGGLLIVWHPFGFQWESIFMVNIPVGITALLAGIRYLPNTTHHAGTRIDTPGMLLLILFLSLIIYPTIHTSFMSVAVCAGLCIPVFLTFYHYENRLTKTQRQPLIVFSFFKDRVFTLGAFISFLFYFSSAFFLAYGTYLQESIGWSAIQAGMAIIPLGMGYVLLPLLSARIIRYTGNYILSFGLLLYTAGFACMLMALQHSSMPGGLFFTGLFIAGSGMGTTFSSLLRISLSKTPHYQVGLASGMITSILQIGSGLSAAALGGLFFREAAGAGGYNMAFQHVLQIVIALQLVSLALSLRLIKMVKRLSSTRVY